MTKKVKNFYIYALKCVDKSIYFGIALDPHKRLQQHRSGRGASYVRAHLPVELVYTEGPYPHGEALAREYRLKRLSRKKKLELIFHG